MPTKIRSSQNGVLFFIAAGSIDAVVGRALVQKPFSIRVAQQLVELGYLTDLGARDGGRVFELTDAGRDLSKTIKPRKK